MVKYEKIQNDEKLPIKLLKIGGSKDGHPAIAKHWHNSIEIIYPHIGDCEFWIDGENIHVPENGLYIINSQAIHGFDEVAKGKFFHGYTLQIQYTFIKEMFPQIDSYYFIQANNEVATQLKEDIIHISNEYSNQSEFKNIMIQSHICSLVYTLLDNLLYKKKYDFETNSKKNKKRITHIINYIDEHYCDDLALDILADKFALSQGHLSRIFKDNLDTTVMNYVSLQRLKKARLEMLESDFPLIDVAINNGFSSLKAFSRLFKKEFGTTPNNYRKKYNMSSNKNC